MSLGGHNQEKKENVTVTTPTGWIGASTHAKLNSTQTQAGWIGVSTQATPHVSKRDISVRSDWDIDADNTQCNGGRKEA